MVWNPGDDPIPFLPTGQELGLMGDQLMGFMSDPRGQAALMSTGLAMMQPPAWGDNFTSQLGRAIGAGGESVRTGEALDIKKAEAESKQDLRGAQATAAEARAGAAAARSGTAEANLSLRAQQLQQLQERNLANQKIRLNAMHQNYLKNLAQENLLLPPDKKKPALPIDEWVKTNPMLATLGLVPNETGVTVPDDGTGTTQQPGAAPPVGTRRPGKGGVIWEFQGGDQYDQKNWKKVSG